MIKIVTPNNIEFLTQFTGVTVWIPVLSNLDIHYSETTISYIYLYNVDTGLECVVGINTLNIAQVSILDIQRLLTHCVNVAYNSKYLDAPDFFIDVEFYLWYYHNDRIDTQYWENSVHQHYMEWYRDLPNPIDVVPIMSGVIPCQQIKDHILQRLSTIHSTSDGFKLYSQLYSRMISTIEHYGVAMMNVGDVKIYRGLLNPFTLTGRPSYTVGGLHFNSMNKRDGARSRVVSRFLDGGQLVEIDYDSYHLRLIASIISYELPIDVNVHEHFAKQYFNVNHVDDEMRSRSKNLTFSQLYGGIQSQYMYIEFFKRVSIFIDALWDTFIGSGVIHSHLMGRPFESTWYTDMNKYKLFSYYIQSLETERNIGVINQVIDYLSPYGSGIVAYTYDSILIDFHKSEGIDILYDIHRLMTQDQYSATICIGTNYHDMVEVNMVNR